LLAIPLRVAGLLHPAANRGVHRVSLLVAPVARSGRRSRDASYPSKDSPHPQPYRVTTACALLPFPRRVARTSRVRVAARTVQSASRRERRLQGFALWMGPYHRAPFPTSDGLPSRGLLFPLQGPSIPTFCLRSRSRRTADPPPRTCHCSDRAHSSGLNRRTIVPP
jgi:hypothetical protein